MDHLGNDHSVQPAERVVGDENDRLAVRRDVLCSVNGSRAAQLFVQYQTDEIVVPLGLVFAQEGIHLVHMRNTLQVADKKIRHVRFGRFAPEDSPYVKLQRHYCTA